MTWDSKALSKVAKELDGWGITAKAVNINGVMNIVIENYKPRYLDLGIRRQEATPQMLKIGHALNTVQGNISFLRGNIFVELVFSSRSNFDIKSSLNFSFHHTTNGFIAWLLCLSTFYIGKKASELGDQYKYTDPMKREVER